jgi:hypothetical protein
MYVLAMFNSQLTKIIIFLVSQISFSASPFASPIRCFLQRRIVQQRRQSHQPERRPGRKSGSRGRRFRRIDRTPRNTLLGTAETTTHFENSQKAEVRFIGRGSERRRSERRQAKNFRTSKWSF